MENELSMLRTENDKLKVGLSHHNPFIMAFTQTNADMFPGCSAPS
jgi:hypothetical protein